MLGVFRNRAIQKKTFFLLCFRRTPLSSSMSTFAIQMYHCKRLRQFKEIIARKLHKYSISNDNLYTNIQKFPKQHLISLESTRHAHVCCMHAFVTQWRYYYKVFISQVVYNIRGVLYGPHNLSPSARDCKGPYNTSAHVVNIA